MKTKKASKKSAAKKPARKQPLNNKGVKKSKTGNRYDFSNTALAKRLKAHNQYMPHGYEIVTNIINSKTRKPLK